MDVSDEEIHRLSHSQLLKYTLYLRKDVRKNGHLYSLKGKNDRNKKIRTRRQETRDYGHVYPYSTSWFDIPEELREMVIDKIDPETVAQFKQCSKLCGEEAKRSKNSMYKIEVNYTEDGTHICFYLTNENRDCPHFRYSFSEDEGTICHERINMEDEEEYTEHSYINTLKDEKWEIKENGDMESAVAKYLEKFLEEYQYSLKALKNDAKLDMKHLKNLQHIEFDNCDVLENDLMTFDQILKCRETVTLRETKFSFDQIVQLKGEDINIGGKDLTNEQIKIYLKMWENGEIDENVRSITIDTEKLKILDDEYYTDGLLTVIDDEEPAKKRYRSNTFSFDMKGSRQGKIHVWLADEVSCTRLPVMSRPFCPIRLVRQEGAIIQVSQCHTHLNTQNKKKNSIDNIISMNF
ncbi:unnamed protein product [Caenorhabditis angaria]|uniref:F-box domain-containing protein n=1 Tax=Caenorhabditis angaria TaxID=860376 RepID=A0A9P1IC39_9PELO|nr:unnamed protein product [Caenorhabditis angaria]